MTDKLTDKVVQVRDDQSEIIELLRNEKSMTVPIRRVYALNLHLEIDRLRARVEALEAAYQIAQAIMRTPPIGVAPRLLGEWRKAVVRLEEGK